jgi:hypothetical protein
VRVASSLESEDSKKRPGRRLKEKSEFVSNLKPWDLHQRARRIRKMLQRRRKLYLLRYRLEMEYRLRLLHQSRLYQSLLVRLSNMA